MLHQRIFGRLLIPAVAALAALALLAPSASAATPAPGYAQFAGCPSPEENPNIEACITSVVDGGHFQMGSKNVPITKPIKLSFGVEALFQGYDTSPAGGLAPAKQEVPGGVIGLTGLDWLINFLSLEGLKLYAVTELAGTPTNISTNTITLPVKVHLINPVLGNSCYVGSSSNPIVLNLITGTTNPPPPNEPITGKEPEFGVDFEKEIFQLKNGTFVDNSFAAPGANGCKLTLFGFLPISINGLVNTQSGLPAAAGTNETVQHFDNEIAAPFRVYP